MTTDLIAIAVAQLGSIMAANWTLTEAVGNRLRWPKFGLSLIIAPSLTAAAYALGWFNALPTVAAGGVPVAGARAYLSAAFAGFVGAILTSAAHKALIGSRGAPPAAGGPA